MIGVRADGRKELVAHADSSRESVESWADLLRDCRRRHRTKVTKGPGSRAAGLAMAFKLIESVVSRT